MGDPLLICKKTFFSLAIKTCKVTNEIDSQKLFLIENFCETNESDPLVRKNQEGKS